MLIKMRDMMRRKDNQKGFTLIELIVVMAILAILAALAIPKFTGVMSTSKQSANDSNVDLIAHAAETYYDSHAQTMPTAIGTTAAHGAGTLWGDGYLKNNPTAPVSGTIDGYSISSAGNVLTVTPGKCVNGVPAPGGTLYTF